LKPTNIGEFAPAAQALTISSRSKERPSEEAEGMVVAANAQLASSRR